jgi:hypothetical protein
MFLDKLTRVNDMNLKEILEKAKLEIQSTGDIAPEGIRLMSYKARNTLYSTEENSVYQDFFKLQAKTPIFDKKGKGKGKTKYRHIGKNDQDTLTYWIEAIARRDLIAEIDKHLSKLP